VSNALELENHTSFALKRANQDFHYKNYRRLDRILQQNKNLYRKIISYKSDYAKDKQEQTYIKSHNLSQRMQQGR